MRSHRWIDLAAACALLLLVFTPAAAQTRLFPGVSIQGRIASDTPLNITLTRWPEIVSAPA